MYPAKFLGLGEALIFFCFFSSIKGRKEDNSRTEKNAYSRYRLFVSYQKTPKGRIQYAPTACRPIGFGFVLPQVPVKPAGFHSDLWQSLKPAGFYTMSCGKVQNPPGFTPCRVAKSKTRRVSRYVVWQSLKPAGFYAMSCGKAQNPPGFAPCRLAKPKTRRVSRYVVWRSPKPAGFYSNLWQNECETYQVSGCRGVLHTPLGRPRKGTFVPMALFILK